MDPTFVINATKAVLAAKRALDTAALRRRVDRIEATVDAIGHHLAGNQIAEIRAGFSHLETAVTSSNGKLRTAKLGFARQSFNRLSNRTGSDPLLAAHSGMTNQQVSALGHFGNYYYFMLADEPMRSLIAAYHVAELFPPFGVLVLPAELFSRDYCCEVPGMSETREQLAADYRSMLGQHKETRRSYRLDMAWRVPAAAGAVIVGLMGSLASPSMAAHGAQWALGILSASENGVIPPARPSQRPYLERGAQAEKAWRPLVEEARERRVAIEKKLGSS